MSYDWREAEKNQVELLFVQDGAGRQVVEVPAFQAEVGDLVEYIMPGTEEAVVGFTGTPEVTCLGMVLKKMHCDRFDNEWSCIAEIAAIRRGKAVYHPTWSRGSEEF